MDANNAVNKIDLLIVQMKNLRDYIAGSKPNQPDSAVKEMADGLCLWCKEEIYLPIHRGCHEKCHKKAKRAIKEGKTTEFELIEEGLLDYASLGGRPRVPDPFESKRNTTTEAASVKAALDKKERERSTKKKGT